ncbi:MAG: Ig-like domain-containing protein, partial [Thermoplasmata archaeon]|nr:Ig-like domain-containing protein [Thermoplasmata archaeon]
LVTDRIYHGPGKAEENATTVRVKHGGWDASANVNMSTTHTEWFDEGSGAGNIRPFCAILEPDEGDTVGGDYTVTGNASDEDGFVTNVWVRIDDGTWQVATGTTQWSYEWNTSRSGDGNHTILARSYDNEGAVSLIAFVNVTVDNTNFPPKVRIDDPSEDDEVSGDVVVSGTASDEDGEEDIDVVQVAAVPEGEVPAEEDWEEALDTSGNDTWATWEYTWDTSDEADGNYTLWARADDGIARGYWRVNVTLYDQDPPFANVTLPEEGWHVNGTIAINGTASDPDPSDEVEHVYVAVVTNGTSPKGSDWMEADDAAGPGEPPFANWTLEWDSTTVEDEDYTIHVRAYDGTDASRVWLVNITVDNFNSAPRTVLERPEEMDDVSGIVNITGYVVDPDDELDSVEMAIDDQDFNSNALSVTIEKVDEDRWNISAEWDTTVYNEGKHTIFARSTDARGSISNRWAVNVTVYGNVPPDIWFVEPSEEIDLYKGEGTKYYIQWGDDDPDDNASIKLFYDTDDDMEDGVLVAQGLYEDTKDSQGRELDKYEWDFGDVPEGDYYLYAEIDDDENAVQKAMSPMVSIHEGTPNTAPEADLTQPDGEGDVIELDGTYVIYFNVTDEDDDLADIGVSLYRDDDTDPENGRVLITGSLDGEDTMFEWNTSGIARGLYYVHIRADDGSDEGWDTGDGPLSIGDMTPPGIVRNLTVEDTGFGRSIGLTWDAPGDDIYDGGRAHHYELRWHTEEVDEDSWDEANPVDISGLAPADPGAEQRFIVSGLTKGTLHFIGIRAVDDEGNVGPLRSGSATPERVSRQETIAGYVGFNVRVDYVGTGTLSAVQASPEQFVPTNLADLGIFVEVVGTGYLRDVYLNVTYPAGGVAGIDLSDSKIYWKSSAVSWQEMANTGHEESGRLIWGELDHYSVFAPMGVPLAEAQLTGFGWDPEFPGDGENVRFFVTYTDPIGRAPDRISLRITPQDGVGATQTYQMALVSGDVTTGAIYEVEWSFRSGTYRVLVRANIDELQFDSGEDTLTVAEKDEDDDELPWPMIIGGVIAVVVVLILVTRMRKRSTGKEAAKDISADVVEATVVGPESFQEVEVTGARATPPPGGEVPPYAAGEGATEGEHEAEEFEAEVAPTEGMAPPPVPSAPPARLKLPEIPGAPLPAPAPPAQAIEADVVDTGRLMVAPCPTCGNRLVIPKERPADITCQKCGDEFTIN